MKTLSILSTTSHLSIKLPRLLGSLAVLPLRLRRTLLLVLCSLITSRCWKREAECGLGPLSLEVPPSHGVPLSLGVLLSFRVLLSAKVSKSGDRKHQNAARGACSVIVTSVIFYQVAKQFQILFQKSYLRQEYKYRDLRGGRNKKCAETVCEHKNV